MSLGTFCPLGHFVLGTFCPWDFCPLGRFVPWDVLSVDVLSWDVLSVDVLSWDVLSWDVLSLGTFCPWDLMSWDVLSWDVLSVHQNNNTWIVQITHKSTKRALCWSIISLVYAVSIYRPQTGLLGASEYMYSCIIKYFLFIEPKLALELPGKAFLHTVTFSQSFSKVQ